MSAQGAINVRNKVSDLQSKLSHAAKQSLDRRFGAFVRERLRIFLKRKYSDQSKGTWRVHNNLVVRLGLYQFG
jgi:hypothetical protein